MSNQPYRVSCWRLLLTISSTVAVYSSMPALIESRMPLVMLAPAALRDRLVRVARPMPMPSGVTKLYRIAPATGTQLRCEGRLRKASREPRPRPSNISVQWMRQQAKRREKASSNSRWKMMTTKRVLYSSRAAVDNVRPVWADRSAPEETYLTS